MHLLYSIAPLFLLYFLAKLPEPVSALVVARTLLWPPGSTLQVYFNEEQCDEEYRQFIEEVANEWTKDINIKFVFGSESLTGDLGITCDAKNVSRSLIGTESRKERYSMNIGRPKSDIKRKRNLIRSQILHEFG